MFGQFLSKVSDFALHHQVVVAGIVTVCVVLATWGIENLVERYFLPNRAVLRYILAVVSSALLLWFIQHTVLHVI